METQKKSDSTVTSFEEYRDKMHPEREEGRSVMPAPGHYTRIAFAIFMIIIYVGVGVLLLVNAFHWTSLAWARYVIGIMLIVYGIFRAFRYFKGFDYYSNK